MGGRDLMFEVGETYMTRNNKEARIICVDRAGSDDSSIVALVREDNDPNTIELIVTYDKKGQHYHSPKLDLVVAREVVWMNLYPAEKPSTEWRGAHQTESEALAHAGNDAIEVAVPFMRIGRSEVRER